MAVVEGRRPLPPQCSNPEGARYLNSHWKYLSWLGLQDYMENLCKKLLSKPKLPHNPYPGFVQHLHQQAQRMRLESSVSVQRLGRDVSFSSDPGVKWSISDTGGSSPVCGLSAILRYVDPESVAQYTWLIHDVTFPLSSFRNARPYTVQVLPALTGSCIFSGTFFLMPPSVDILQILVVIGPDVDRAIELYSQSVLEDLTRLLNQRRHLIYRICVPVDEGSKVEIFTETDIKIRAAEFQSCVQHAAHCRKQVRAECLWRIDPTGADFQRGSKGYDLSVIQTGQGLREERVIDFSGCPLQHLFSSLFLQRSHAEAYVGLFMPCRERVNPGVLSPQTSQADNMTANGSGIPSFSEPPDPVHSERLYSDEVLLQIQDGLLHRMAMASPLPEGMLERAHLTILLLLSEEGKELSQSGAAGDPESLQGLDAIGRFLGGPAEYFWSIDILMKTLEMTVAFEGEQALKQEALSVQLARANHWAEEDLSSSADFPALRRRLRMHLLAAVRELSMQGSEARALQNVQAARGIGQVLLAQLLEDSLPWMPALLEAERRASDVKSAKPHLSAANTNREVRKHQDPAAEQEAELLYSTESYVEMPAKNAEMAHCQYLVDCRLEQHWQEALKEVLSLSSLLLNPYPRIASAFRKASMRMDLWHHSDGDLLKSVLQIPPETLEGQKDIFRVPGIAGFGLRSAVSAPNTKLLGAALNSCALLRNTSWEPCLGPFKVTVSCALHRPGVLDHFLNSVEMSEFCSIEGHRGCQLEALQTYAKLVLTHLSDVQHRQGVVAPMVQIGVSDSWSPRRTQRYPLAFTETFIEALQSGRPVCMKAWKSPEGSGWHTVPMVKHLVLHYREGGVGRWFSFSELDPLTLYCAIFHSKEEAAFEFQKTGSSRDLFSNSALQRPLSQLDSQILRDYHARDLLNVSRHVASRALLTGEHEALPSCWRVLHSMAAQLEYLNGVNTTAQAFLVMEELERAELAGSAGVRGSERADSPELGRLISGLCVSLERTLCHSSALAPHSLWEMVERKMLVVSGGGKVQERVGALKVIHVMCQAVMMTTFQDLISLCPEIQAIVQQLQRVEPQENQLVIRNSQPAQWDRGLRARPTTYTALEGW